MFLRDFFLSFALFFSPLQLLLIHRSIARDRVHVRVGDFLQNLWLTLSERVIKSSSEVFR